MERALIELVVDLSDQWQLGQYEAVFSSSTTPIMAAASVPPLLAGAARMVAPGRPIAALRPLPWRWRAHGIQQCRLRCPPAQPRPEHGSARC